MAKDEILGMKAGRELNILVAKEVMERGVADDETFGFMEKDSNGVYGPLQPYSEDIAAAWLIVEKLRELNPRVEFDSYSRKWEASFSVQEADFTCPVVMADGAPEAICKAALLALQEVRRDSR